MNLKQDRNQLKTYFETGDRPTEEEFGVFIDSGINQIDDQIYVDANKNVGIGTDSPVAKLEVKGDIRLSGHLTGNKQGVTQTDFLVVGNGSEVQMYGQNHPSRSGDLFLIGKPAMGSGKISFDQQTGHNQWINRMLIDSNGNIGIGTSSPTNKLDIASGSSTTGLRLRGGAGQDKILVSDANGNARWEQPTLLTNGFWKKNGTHIQNNNTGRVGIHSNNPIGILQVDDGINRVAIGNAYHVNGSTSNTGYATGYIGFNAARSNGNWLLQSDGGSDGGAVIFADVAGCLNFSTLAPGTKQANLGKHNQTSQSVPDLTMVSKVAMRVTSEGKVGIGIREPMAKLDVVGNIALNDNTLLLRSGSDKYHGVSYDPLLDGVRVFGHSGGALGALDGSSNFNNPTKITAMKWGVDSSVDFLGKVRCKGNAAFIRRRFFIGADNSRRDWSELDYESSDVAYIKNYSPNDWEAVIVGFQFDHTSIDGSSGDTFRVMTDVVNSRWKISTSIQGTDNDHYVDILFLRKSFF